MDIPWDVDKALEVLQESGKLRMENIKKGGNSFGRELQEEPLKIFTHCKQIPGAMEGWNFNLQQSCSRTGVTTSSGGWQAVLEWISQKSSPSPSPCARGGVFIQHPPAEAVFSSAATKNLLPSCTGMMEGSWVFLTSYFGVNIGILFPWNIPDAAVEWKRWSLAPGVQKSTFICRLKFSKT